MKSYLWAMLSSAAAAMLLTGPAHAQTLHGEALVKALRKVATSS